MARTSNNSLKLDADFTEDAVGLAIESLLTLLSFPRLRFTIEPFSRSKERWLGADARLDGERVRGFRPFYMQFKRPSAYPEASRSKIVSARRKLGLPVAPRSLFFPLRAKSDNHSDYQHNILFRLQRRLRKYNLGNAAYVCPLFLERAAYRFHVQLAGLIGWPRFWRYHPWELEDVLVDHGSRAVRFDRIPVLAEHISVPPHEIVEDAKHSYSFDEYGTHLCFHSPVSLPEGASRLDVFLKAIAEDFLSEGGKVTSDTAFQSLALLLGEEGDEKQIFPNASGFTSEDPIGSWLFWGDVLRREFDIEQYAFVAWEEMEL